MASFTFQLHDIQLYDQGYLLFGRDKQGDTVSVHLSSGAEVYFYLRLRDRAQGSDVSDPELHQLKSVLNNKLREKLSLNSTRHNCSAMQCACENKVFVDNQFGPDMSSICKEKLDRMLQKDGRRGDVEPIYRVEREKGRSIIGYEPNDSTFVRLTLRSYGMLKVLKSLFMKSKPLMKAWEPFEIGLDPLVRFMADMNIVGHGFINVRQSDHVPARERVTRCNREVKSCQSKITALKEEESGLSNYPVRMLSFDIECCSFRSLNAFPDAKKGDPVIQIGVVGETLFSTTSDAPRCIVFCLDKVDPIPNGEVQCFKTEQELLRAFYQYVIVEFEADIVTGYNSNQFDMPYILERAEQLKLREFRTFSKMTKRSIRHWKQKFESAQAGTRITDQYNTPGLVMFDVFNYVKKTMNLRSYSLNNVAIAVLKDEKKDDMKYSDIPIFQRQGPDKRAIIAKYCMQDTLLVSKLINVRKMLVNNIEFSRICGVLLQHSFEKGVSFKILRKVLQDTTVDKFYIPTFERNEDGEQIVPYYDAIVNEKAEYEDDEGQGEVGTKRKKQLRMTDMFAVKKKKNHSWTKKYNMNAREKPKASRRLKFQGAFVLDPKSGFHEDIVATLDFASLYPSEMRMHNMCPSTLLQSHEHAASIGLVLGRDYEEVASGFLFVTKNVRQGVLPRIETELHAARKAAKGELKAAKKAGDAMLTSVYDGKQLAIKLVMNSIYGTIGSRKSMLNALPVAVSITAQGRYHIMATKRWVEKNFRVNFCKDAPGRANVVYGDTGKCFTTFISSP